LRLQILGYLRQYKLFRQIPSYSGLKKIDLVELVHTFLHKYHAEAAQARASQPGAFPGPWPRHNPHLTFFVPDD